VAGTEVRWWQRPDHYDWYTAYLKDRGLQEQWRAAIVAFTCLLAGVPLILISSPTGPDHRQTVAVSLIATGLGALAAVVWLRRWPTRRESMLYCMLASVSTALACLAQSAPYATVMGCTAFAIIGGFIAHFHAPALVAGNVALALTCAGIGAYRLVSATGDLALAGSGLLIVGALNIGVPFGIHSLSQALRTDLRRAGHDPLTGLLNRRAFHHAVHELLMAEHTGLDTHLVVALIDLDDFKRLNDTRGHAVGDQALIAVADAIRANSGARAVVGRLGGEEFVVARTAPDTHPSDWAEGLRRGIADVPYQVTASIGTAGARLADLITSDLVDILIHTADAAMYDAKRAGGNRVMHRSGPARGESNPVRPG